MNVLYTDAGLSQKPQSDPGSFVDKPGPDRIAQLQQELAAQTSRTTEIRHKLDLVTRAAGGTIYILEEISAENPADPGEIASRELKFVCLQNETMRATINNHAMKLSEAMEVLGGMVRQGNLDPE